jgi:hypothetical protein
VPKHYEVAKLLHMTLVSRYLLAEKQREAPGEVDSGVRLLKRSAVRETSDRAFQRYYPEYDLKPMRQGQERRLIDAGTVEILFGAPVTPRSL